MKLQMKRLFVLSAVVIPLFCTVFYWKNHNIQIPQKHRDIVEMTDLQTSTKPVDSVKEAQSKIMLVNASHPISETVQVEIRELPNQQKVSIECYDQLMKMLSDCHQAGFSPEVCSGFRTIPEQEKLFWNKVERLMQQGYDYQVAETLAETEVARPGTSEHHTGLAVDIIDQDYPILDESQEYRPTQQWLLENSWKYGFVLRYPADKTDLTGIIYEPWHYRYVGTEAAKEMYERQLCLEEYLIA